MGCDSYTIQLEHGDFIWTVNRRFKHFTALRRHLFLSRTQSVSFTITILMYVDWYLYLVCGYSGLRRGRVPALPLRPEIAVRRATGTVAERRKVRSVHWSGPTQVCVYIVLAWPGEVSGEGAGQSTTKETWGNGRYCSFIFYREFLLEKGMSWQSF